MHRRLKGVPGAAPWGRPCTVWNKWIVDVEHVDGTGSRWSRGKLSGRTRPDHGRGSGLRRPGLYPWSVGRREGENQEHGCQRRKEKGRQGEKEQCGDSSGTHRWVAGTQQDPGGKQSPSGWVSLPREHPQPWVAGAEEGRQVCTDTRVRTVVRSETLPHAHSASGLQCVCAAPARPRGPMPAVTSVSRPQCLPGFWRGGGAVPTSPQHWLPSLVMLPCQIPTPSSTKPGMRASSFGDHGEHSQEERRAENGRKRQLAVWLGLSQRTEGCKVTGAEPRSASCGERSRAQPWGSSVSWGGWPCTAVP